MNVNIINDDYGTAVPEDFLISYHGANLSENFGSARSENTIPVFTGIMYNFTPSYIPSNYTISYSSGCSRDLMTGENATCMITLDDPQPPAPQGEWCYQENARFSTWCGGMSTGSYIHEGAWMDGNWSRDSKSSIGEYYVNYAKPAKILNTSILKVKDFRPGDEIHFVNEGFYTIPAACFKRQTAIRLKFNVTEDSLTILCADSNNSWILMGERHGDGIQLIEEAMLWDMNTHNGNSNPCDRIALELRGFCRYVMGVKEQTPKENETPPLDEIKNIDSDKIFLENKKNGDDHTNTQQNQTNSINNSSEMSPRSVKNQCIPKRK
ncbi:hypothetical protein KW805_03000 [Candidatus Pacearchaeota archaeon]|nr:hypothetical protein [Candidatus Pacearchaeota archaeon]